MKKRASNYRYLVIRKFEKYRSNRFSICFTITKRYYATTSVNSHRANESFVFRLLIFSSRRATDWRGPVEFPPICSPKWYTYTIRLRLEHVCILKVPSRIPSFILSSNVSSHNYYQRQNTNVNRTRITLRFFIFSSNLFLFFFFFRKLYVPYRSANVHFCTFRTLRFARAKKKYQLLGKFPFR